MPRYPRGAEECGSILEADPRFEGSVVDEGTLVAIALNKAFIYLLFFCDGI
jgi:hypothetical protein